MKTPEEADPGLRSREWEESGETEAEFYRRALREVLGWGVSADPNDFSGNLYYALASCGRVAQEALMGEEFNTGRKLAKLQAEMAQEAASEYELGRLHERRALDRDPQPRAAADCGLCHGTGTMCSKDAEWEACYRCGGTGEEQT